MEAMKSLNISLSCHYVDCYFSNSCRVSAHTLPPPPPNFTPPMPRLIQFSSVEGDPVISHNASRATPSINAKFNLATFYTKAQQSLNIYRISSMIIILRVDWIKFRTIATGNTLLTNLKFSVFTICNIFNALLNHCFSVMIS